MTKFLFNKWKEPVQILSVLLLPAIIIYSLFKKIFECPACYLFSDGGDGLKNYFTVDYYVKHDKGWHFSGMNYPYGENIIYTDNQPILSIFLRWLDRHVLNMDDHVIGTMNILMLVSIYFAVLVAYKILRRWGVSRLWSFGSAMIVIFLSSQLSRLHGHYGLAYVVYLPSLILLLDLIVRHVRLRWLWTLLTFMLIMLMSLSHMYFLLISLVMISSFTLFWWWYHREQKAFVSSVLPFLLVAIITPAALLTYIKFSTDKIADRPIEPAGILQHNVSFESTFFSFIPPLDNVWTSVLNEKKPIGEKVAHTGIIGLLLLPAVIFFLFQKRDNDFMNTHVKSFIGASVICWLMAAGFFYQYGFKFLWDGIPALKQFRGMGRIGMAFYYLYLLGCCYLLWRFFVRLQEKNLTKHGTYLLSGIFVLWGFEAWLNIKSIRDPIFHENKYLSSEKDNYIPILTASGYQPEDFQAILQLPLVAIGNENLGVARGFWTLREGIHASTETGLPLIDYAMSRTSVSQGLDIINLISAPYSQKTRALLFNDKPILLLCEEEFVIASEKKWIDRAIKIGQYQSITLYSLSPEVFKIIQLPTIDTFISTMTCEGWFDGFDHLKCDTVMSGSGALIISKEQQSIWSHVDTNTVKSNWIVSFWSHIDNMQGHVPVPRMMEINPEGVVLQNSGLHRESIDWSEAWNDWINISFPLQMLGKGHKYELFIDQTGPVIDNLLIFPADDTCIIKTPEFYLFNNLPIPFEK